MTHTIRIHTHEFVNGEDMEKRTKKKKKGKSLLTAEKHDLFSYTIR